MSHAGRLLVALALLYSLAQPLGVWASGSEQSEPLPDQPAAAADVSTPASRPQRNGGPADSGVESPETPARFVRTVSTGFLPPAMDIQTARFMDLYSSPGGLAWLRQVFARSVPYSAYIQDRIAAYGLPPELFFLPFIESEFQARAVSRSGAVGLWQFMKNSIGGFDMRVDEWRDDRRDFMKATDAALQKLRWNHQYYKDWLLAIAAYNCGVGALDRAIARAGGERDFWKLRAAGVLPAETASYIPKFVAVAQTGMKAGRLGLWPESAKSVQWATLPLDGPVDINMLAERIALPIELLRLANSELVYTVTPPDGNYRLKLPAEQLADAGLALASTDSLIKVYIHEVRSGDTVSAISRHYEVGLDMIVKMNKGLNPDRIRIGQRLIIPALKDKTPYAGVPEPVVEHAFDSIYIVQQGDTLWSISRRFSVPVEQLAAQNGMTINTILREGMSLNVPIIEE